MAPRCHCGHSYDGHRHYRPGTDCSECGPGLCYRYASRAEHRPDSHREVSAVNDAHLYRNLWALGSFAQSSRVIAASRIPQQRPRPAPVAAWLEQKRAKNRKGPR